MHIDLDDISVNFETLGTGDATIVMVHSLGYNLGAFDGLVSALRDRFKIVRYDLRGHGASSLGNRAPSLDVLADDLVRLTSALGIQSAHYLGQSIGAMTLLKAACDQRLSGTLFLLDVVGWTDEKWNIKYSSRALDVEREGMGPLAKELAKASLGPSTLVRAPQILAAYEQDLNNAPPQGYAWASRAMVGFDFRDSLPAIKMPTRLLTGVQDPVATVSHMHELAAYIKSATTVAIPDSGHLPVIEQPDRVLTELDEWTTINTLRR